MLVNAKGMLRHCFHGSYSAVIALAFDNDMAADAASVLLGAPWRRSTKSAALTWTGDSAGVDAVKAQFRSKGFTLAFEPCGLKHCRKQCADAQIDGLPHSIDFGPRFTLAIELADPRQGSLDIFKRAE